MVIFRMSRWGHFFNSYFCAVFNSKTKLFIIIAISKLCLNGRSYSSQAAGRVFQTLSKRKAISISYARDRDPGTPAFHSAILPSLATLWWESSQGFCHSHGSTIGKDTLDSSPAMGSNRLRARGPSSHLSTWSPERIFTWTIFTLFSFQALKELTWSVFL